MKFFLDTEFSEDGRSIDLISIALVCENGAEFYRQNAAYNYRQINPGVRDNVVPKLWACPAGMTGYQHNRGPCPRQADCVWRPKIRIRDELRQFVFDQNPADSGTPESPVFVPEFWGEDCAYDFVVISWLFGGINGSPGWPQGWPYFFMDVDAVRHQLGIVSYPPAKEGSHNALTDARYIMSTWRYLSIHQDVQLGRIVNHARWQKAGTVDQESEAVRSSEGSGHVEVAGGSDQQRQREQVKEE